MKRLWILSLGIGALSIGALALKIVGSDHGIEPHGVEITDGDIVAGAAQRFKRRVLHGAIEGFGLGVSVDDQDVQEGNSNQIERGKPSSCSDR